MKRTQKRTLTAIRKTHDTFVLIPKTETTPDLLSNGHLLMPLASVLPDHSLEEAAAVLRYTGWAPYGDVKPGAAERYWNTNLTHEFEDTGLVDCRGRMEARIFVTTSGPRVFNGIRLAYWETLGEPGLLYGELVAHRGESNRWDGGMMSNAPVKGDPEVAPEQARRWVLMMCRLDERSVKHLGAGAFAAGL